MNTLHLRFTFASDATLARGDGVAGLVDDEIEYDSTTGLPFMRGRTLKGLLVEECANILFALEVQGCPNLQLLLQAAQQLFGIPGGLVDGEGVLHIGDARLPDQLCEAVAAEVRRGKLSPADVLGALTDIRRQTSIDPDGAPQEGSLRAARVLIREQTFTADLVFKRQPADIELGLLCACALALRRVGSGRNRGRGRLKEVRLLRAGADITDSAFDQFVKTVKGEAKHESADLPR